MHGRTILKLQAIRVTDWPIKPNWNNEDKTNNFIQCKKYNTWIKTYPCKVGKKRGKVFLKYKGNKHVAGFATYLLRIILGEITQEMHNDFVKAIQKTFKNKTVKIDNLDVDWFHMVQEP